MQSIQGHFELVGVVGDPISHTLSPAIHNLWLADYDIPAVYVPFHLYNQAFEPFIEAIQSSNIRGLNITLPYKERAFRLLGHNLTPEAQKAQAVNVIFRDAKGDFWGDNTDGWGFIKNVERITSLAGKKILIIGAGGASKGIILPLIEKKASITLINRTYEKACALVSGLDCEKLVNVLPFDTLMEDLSSYDMIVNTATLTAFSGEMLERIAYQTAAPHCLFHDINYKPLMTPFLEKADKLGFKTLDGLGMLIGQAYLAFQRMFHVEQFSFSSQEFDRTYEFLLKNFIEKKA